MASTRASNSYTTSAEMSASERPAAQGGGSGAGRASVGSGPHPAGMGAGETPADTAAQAPSCIQAPDATHGGAPAPPPAGAAPPAPLQWCARARCGCPPAAARAGAVGHAVSGKSQVPGALPVKLPPAWCCTGAGAARQGSPSPGRQLPPCLHHKRQQALLVLGDGPNRRGLLRSVLRRSPQLPPPRLALCRGARRGAGAAAPRRPPAAPQQPPQQRIGQRHSRHRQGGDGHALQAALVGRGAAQGQPSHARHRGCSRGGGGRWRSLGRLAMGRSSSNSSSSSSSSHGAFWRGPAPCSPAFAAFTAPGPCGPSLLQRQAAAAAHRPAHPAAPWPPDRAAARCRRRWWGGAAAAGAAGRRMPRTRMRPGCCAVCSGGRPSGAATAQRGRPSRHACPLWLGRLQAEAVGKDGRWACGGGGGAWASAAAAAGSCAAHSRGPWEPQRMRGWCWCRGRRRPTAPRAPQTLCPSPACAMVPAGGARASGWFNVKRRWGREWRMTHQRPALTERRSVGKRRAHAPCCRFSTNVLPTAAGMPHCQKHHLPVYHSKHSGKAASPALRRPLRLAQEAGVPHAPEAAAEYNTVGGQAGQAQPLEAGHAAEAGLAARPAGTRRPAAAQCMRRRAAPSPAVISASMRPSTYLRGCGRPSQGGAGGGVRAGRGAGTGAQHGPAGAALT